jgi:hypothetical protein
VDFLLSQWKRIDENRIEDFDVAIVVNITLFGSITLFYAIDIIP